MAKPRAVDWREARSRRAVDERAVAAEIDRLQSEQRAYRLREIREAQGLTQQEVARRLDLTQPTISALESGDLERSGLATLMAYVEALGGTVEVTAVFGNRRLLLSGGES